MDATAGRTRAKTKKAKAAKAAKPTNRASAKRPAKESLAVLVKRHRQKVAVGSASYQAADAILAEIRARTTVGRRIPLGDGLYGIVVDLLAESDMVFKPVALKRFELQIQDASGAVVRLRDRKRGRGRAST